MSDDETIVDIFAAWATPASRQERPALYRARMAWAARRLSAGRDQPAPTRLEPLRQVGGVAVGDLVEVDYYDRRRQGVVLAWERPGEGDASSSIRFGQTVARIRVDLGASQGLSAPVIVRRPRFRIFPLTPET
jgi:hypothetical protein